jgi:quercetin dioxygenase-like cupin family protein
VIRGGATAEGEQEGRRPTMAQIDMPAAVYDGEVFETISYPADEIRLRVVDAGEVQVAEYRSEDRDGPPPHSHPWHELEYVIEGEVEFRVGEEWTRCGPGSVQLLPAGVPHSVRVPEGSARLLMVTIGAPFDGFAREMATLFARPSTTLADVVETAGRFGVCPATS